MADQTGNRPRAVALDVGRARIGVAATSERGDQALAVAVVERKGTRADIAALLPMFSKQLAEVVVVGLPPAQDDPQAGTRGLVLRFADALRQAQPLPVELVDESDTTVQAHAELRLLGLRAAKRRGQVDAVAAKLILDRWLAQPPR